MTENIPSLNGPLRPSSAFLFPGARGGRFPLRFPGTVKSALTRASLLLEPRPATEKLSHGQAIRCRICRCCQGTMVIRLSGKMARVAATGTLRQLPTSRQIRQMATSHRSRFTGDVGAAAAQAHGACEFRGRTAGRQSPRAEGSRLRRARSRSPSGAASRFRERLPG
jgi:hypothetical protein